MPTPTDAHSETPPMSVGDKTSFVPPFPTWKYALWPQHRRDPLAVIAHARPPPVEIPRQEVPCCTTTGEVRVAVVPKPNCPRSPLPQQSRTPVDRTPQVNPPPAEISIQSRSEPTLTGLGLVVLDPPSPSCPVESLPQHQSDMSSWIPHAWSSPTETEVHFAPVATAVGVVRCAVVPSPSCPNWFEPQHHSDWFSWIPQLNELSPAM